MLDFLPVVLLALHLLLVDVAMAGPLVCIVLEWRGAGGSDASARRLARLATGAFVGGVLLGAILLAERWAAGDRDYFRAAAMIPASRLWFGLAELLFYLACMLAYSWFWNWLRAWRFAHSLLALAASSNLMLHFPALFVIISVISRRHLIADATLDRAAYWRLLLDGEVVSRVVHVWLSSMAVAGVVLMAMAKRMGPTSGDSLTLQRDVQLGAWLALIATVLQLPVGMWVTLEMSESARESLFGGDLLASGLFGVSLVLSLFLAHSLWAVVQGDSRAGHVHRTLITVAAIVLLMVGARWRARELAPAVASAASVLVAECR